MPATVSPLSSHPIPSPHISSTPPSSPPLSLFRKEQAFHELKQRKAHQVEAVTSSSPYIKVKAGQGNQAWVTGSQTPA